MALCSGRHASAEAVQSSARTNANSMNCQDLPEFQQRSRSTTTASLDQRIRFTNAEICSTREQSFHAGRVQAKWLGRRLAGSKASLGLSPLSMFSTTWGICFFARKQLKSVQAEGFLSRFWHRPHSPSYRGVAVTADRRLAASASQDEMLKVWEAQLWPIDRDIEV